MSVQSQPKSTAKKQYVLYDPTLTAVPFSRKFLASSASPRYASSSNQPSLVMRHSSWMREVATKGSRLGPRLQGKGVSSRSKSRVRGT